MKREAIEQLVREWLPRMRLSHWHVTLDWTKDAGKDTVAITTGHDRYDVVTMRFAADYETWTPEFATWTVVHELMHLVTRDMENAADEVAALLPHPARRLARRMFLHEVEGVVDRVAGILVGSDLGVSVRTAGDAAS